MGTLIGFIVGYYLGAKAGPEKIEELTQAWQTIQESEELQALVEIAKATVENAMQQGLGAATNLLHSFTQADSGLSAIKELAGINDNLLGIWGRLAELDELRGLIAAGGTALIAKFLAQKSGAARE
jgi:hypothetical protein